MLQGVPAGLLTEVLLPGGGMMVKVMVMIRTGVTIVIMLTSGREGGDCHDYAGDWNPVLAEKEECANVRKADSILFWRKKISKFYLQQFEANVCSFI